MASFIIDENGEYKYVGNDFEGAPEPDAGPYIRKGGVANLGEKQQQEFDEERAASATAVIEQGPDDRPMFAQNAGQAGGDFLKSVVNPVLSIGTDFVDLGHGLADVLVETGNLVQGKGFDGSKVFDDSDNPLTKWRIDTFRSETQAGQFVNSTLRVGAALATLPKLGLKGLAMPLRLLSKAPVAGEVAAGGAKLINKADKALKATRAPAATKALDAIQKGNKGSKVAKLANADDWLKATYKEVVNTGVGGSEIGTAFRSIERAAKQLTKGKSTIRTVGEALAWDAFVAFNVAGEGNLFLDETMSDFLADVGLPSVPMFQTSYRDTGLEAKFKQMGEGLILGSIISGIMDTARIFRFSQAFKTADPGEQKLIIQALNEEGQTLGTGMSKLDEALKRLPPAGGTGYGAGRGQRMAQNSQLDSMLAQVEETRAKNLLLEEQQRNLRNYIQETGDQWQAGWDLRDMEAANVAQDAAEKRLNKVQNVSVEELPPGGQLAGGQLSVPQQRIYGQEVDVRDITQPRVGGNMDDPALLEAGARIGQPSVQGGTQLPPGKPGGDLAIRPPEPTFTPNSIRAAFDEYVTARFSGSDFVPEELLQKTIKLLPRKRVDAVDYFSKFPARVNSAGMMNASDSLVDDFFKDRGLKEGWITVNRDTLDFQYNRGSAYQLDLGDTTTVQALKADEAAEIERYSSSLSQGQKDRTMGEVQDALDPATRDTAEAGRQYDDFEARDRTPPSPSPEPALVEARRQEQLAGQQADELVKAEQDEIVRAAAEFAEPGSDRQVVAELLSKDIDNLPEYNIEKIGNRQYQILDELGESVDGNTYSTKKGAAAGLNAAQKKQRQGFVDRARAMAQRDSDQVMKVEMGIPITDSPTVRGLLKLTKPQLARLQKLGIPLDTTDLDLSQAELSGMSQSLQTLLESATGQDKRAINNILNKINKQVTSLGPEARFAAEVDRSVAQAKQLSQNGEICF